MGQVTGVKVPLQVMTDAQLREAAKPLWYWMNERQAIYDAREAGKPWPWTRDPILQSYAFCNVFRELDRVTVWIREHIREPFADHPNLWLMIALARTINWPDTLQELMDEKAWPTDGYHPGTIARVLDARLKRGEKTYTGAYMIRAESDPNVPWYSWTKQEYVASIVIGRLWEARRTFDGMWSHACQPSLQQVHAWLASFHGWGGFMAYEVVTDLRHTRYLRNAPDIYGWANAGPGAVRGLNRLWGREYTAGLGQEEANRMMRQLLRIANGQADDRGPAVGPHVIARASLPAGFLEARDIEHSLCECDKYLRVKLGQGKPRAKFRPPEA
jgi:hypothetical protein